MNYTSEDYEQMARDGFVTMYQVDQAIRDGQKVFFTDIQCTLLNDQPIIPKPNSFGLMCYDSIYDYSCNHFGIRK